MDFTYKSEIKKIIQSPGFKRSLPFAIYMLFILITNFLQEILPEHFTEVYLIPILYPLKIAGVAAVLIFYRKSYDELYTHTGHSVHMLFAGLIGVLVFFLWIHMDWESLTLGTLRSYNPSILPAQWFTLFIVIRILGSSVIVPVFEELFWRSFIVRYIIDPDDFMSVRIGTFTWLSFIVSSVLFGLEHHFWLAGIMCGMLYNFILYKTKSIPCCIIAHSITNFLLGVYVLKTGNWHFW